MAETKQAIFEYRDADKRLGRNVRHDGRSLAYPAAADGTKKTARWERQVPVFNQGDLGSCTGNASVGVLATTPFYDTVKGLHSTFDENFAVEVYESATQLDEFPGQYKPTDTGSTGLAVAKALKNLGLIAGYTHILDINAAYTAIQSGPFIVGTNWMSGMDEPDANGLVKVSGYVRGGHEYEIIGFDADKGLWEAVNSWGTSWGVAGHFFITDTGFQALLKADGDATVFVPLGAVAPSPQPIPNPSPTPTPVPGDGVDETLWNAVSKWATKGHTTPSTKKVGEALNTWAKGKGFVAND